MSIHNIHCLALNYQGVGVTDQDPIYFLKSTSCLAKERDTIPFPTFKVSSVWTEVELGIRIKHTCENISDTEASDIIDGFFVAADITTSNIYGRDHHLAFSKARTGFAPVSSTIVPLDLHNRHLVMRTYINGKLSQEGSTSSMILNPYQSISYISKLVRLNEGDIILTGTPAGAENNVVVAGDTVRHTIEAVGELNYTFSL